MSVQIKHASLILIPKNQIASGMIVGLTLEHSRWRLKMKKLTSLSHFEALWLLKFP
jgi:hypothetical protein